ncbi:hypothetical protein FB550_101194 [Neobacillus bataviensis]|uniref:Uncharacterized protein n=1 Tax=Neobacillus bataviensis TaxID=220685 RepID=A0A561DXX0_9BACI|nr:hypothetical protein [Neobacillus bataviensis]TWE08180.1 hypothetical protein FB550_101194 [Neobacillus bataviensis]
METNKKEKDCPDHFIHSGEMNSKVGEKVKIIKINKESMELEDYFYLKKFENRIGTIIEQNHCHSGIDTYRVEFDQNKFGYFYDKDFVLTAETN